VHRRLLAACSAALLPLAAAAQSGARAASEDELLRVESARSEAIQRGDLKTLEEIYADDFVGVAGTGQLVTKAQLLEFFKSADPALRFTTSEVFARPLGDGGIVVGRLAGRRQDGSLISEARFLHVYVRRDGRLRFAAGQSTPVLPTPDPLPARLPPGERQLPRPPVDEPVDERSAGITPAQRVYEVQPPWLGRPGPRQAHAQVQIVIQRDGRVSVEQVWNATDFEWGQACRQAVSQWRYAPARKDGRPVAVRATVSCALNLP
jgi:ketosteroid isomerase-like protein